MLFEDAKPGESGGTRGRWLIRCAITASVGLLLAAFTVTGVRWQGRNSDCAWPEEASRGSQAATVWHLSADAEFAGELADRFTGAHHGPQSGQFISLAAAFGAKGDCLAKLLDQISQTHGVTRQQLAVALDQNRNWADWAESLSFLLLYAVIASLASRRVWSRYPPTDGWREGILLLAFCSLVFAAGAVALGEFFVTLAESVRIGTGHLGNRMGDSFFSRHHVQLFEIGFVIFWLMAVESGWQSAKAGIPRPGDTGIPIALT